jgi:hypothetical protein
MPKDRDQDLPSTLQGAPAKAKRTWREGHDSADRTGGNVQDVWRALGGTVEHRF